MSSNPVIGKWWHPERPDQPTAGMLGPSSAGGIQLTLIEPLRSVPPGEVSAIHGVANRTAYTLVNPVQYWSHGDTEHWLAMTVVKGEHLPTPSLAVKQIAFQMEGLQDWSHVSGIMRTMTSSELDAEVAFDFRYERPATVQLHVDDVSVGIGFDYSFPMPGWGIKFVEDTLIMLISSTSRTISQWHFDYIRPLQRLVQFATRRLGKIYFAGIVPPEEGSRLASLHGVWIDETASRPEPGKVNTDVLFTLRDHVSTTTLIESWFDVYRRLKRPIDAYLEDHLSTSDFEVRPLAFFSAARLIEQFKQSTQIRDKFSDETLSKVEQAIKDHVASDEQADILRQLPTLRRRASKDSMTRFVEFHRDSLQAIGVEELDPAAIGKLFGNTRNYEAHHNPEKAAGAAKGLELANLTALCTLLIDIEISSLIGLDMDKVYGKLRRDMRVFRASQLVDDLKSL
jgi:hypothetical protein